MVTKVFKIWIYSCRNKGSMYQCSFYGIGSCRHSNAKSCCFLWSWLSEYHSFVRYSASTYWHSVMFDLCTSHLINVLKCLLNFYLVTVAHWYTLHSFVIHSLTLLGISAIVGLDLNNLEDSGGGPAFVVGYFPKHDKLSLLQVKPSCISDLRLFWDAVTFSFCLDVKMNKQPVQQPITTVAYIHLGHVCMACFIIPNLQNCCWHPRFCFIFLFLHIVLSYVKSTCAPNLG